MAAFAKSWGVGVSAQEPFAGPDVSEAESSYASMY